MATEAVSPAHPVRPVTVIGRLIAGFLAGALAVAAQYLAVWSVWHPMFHIDPFVLFFLIQAVAGLAQAIVCRAFQPIRYREPRGWAILLLWLLCTFVPLFGGLVVLASVLWTAWFPGTSESDQLIDVPRPQFVTYLVSRANYDREERLQAKLHNPDISANDRLSALVAIQDMPTRTTGTLLRELLADPVEDIRLIAYGTLDHAENEIMQLIYASRRNLEAATDDTARHALNRRLAELHFELVYQNLVLGAVHRHTIEQAETYARAGLATDDTDAALWLICGRLALAANEPVAAKTYLLRAQALGFPRERLIPWLAEVAYLQRQFPLVGELLRSLDRGTTMPMLKPVVSYWS